MTTNKGPSSKSKLSPIEKSKKIVFAEEDEDICYLDVSIFETYLFEYLNTLL